MLERAIGQRPIAEIEPFKMLEAVRKYETTSRTETAHSALQFSSQKFRFAIANQFATSGTTSTSPSARRSAPQYQLFIHTQSVQVLSVGSGCAAMIG